MIKIFHNNRCSKSRQGLQILKDAKIPFETVYYLENTLSKAELTEIIKMLDIKPIQLIRKGEKIWKENYKDKDLTDNEIIQAMIKNPKLIERPIVIKDNKAVIGRPPENIIKLIKD